MFVAKMDLIPASVSTQVIQRDRHAEYMNTLAVIGATLEKISIEIRHLQRTEVLEAEEFFSKGQKGSSAMPHKRNPVISERITGLARVLRANAVAALENVALWHERDISHSSVERIIIPAHSQAQREIQQAKLEIQRDVDAGRQQLRTEIADLAVQAAGKILDETLDAQKNKKIVDNFLNQLPNS